VETRNIGDKEGERFLLSRSQYHLVDKTTLLPPSEEQMISSLLIRAHWLSWYTIIIKTRLSIIIFISLTGEKDYRRERQIQNNTQSKTKMETWNQDDKDGRFLV